MKYFAFLLVLFICLNLHAQTANSFEKYPVFPQCASVEIDALENCFNSTIQQYIFENFKVPAVVSEENYKRSITVCFEVDKEGNFRLLYTDATYNDLKEEAQGVFESLPKIAPAT